MDTLAALALASAPPNRKILDRKPDRKSAPLLSSDMLKMILGQAIFQAIVCLVLHFVGLEILNEEHTDANEAELSSLVFNVFVFCQICKCQTGVDTRARVPTFLTLAIHLHLVNIINCRRVDRKFNIFEDIHRNLWFIGIFMISEWP
jgi:Ca2+-transporting ATPase